jgi:hypothetical protein
MFQHVQLKPSYSATSYIDSGRPGHKKGKAPPPPFTYNKKKALPLVWSASSVVQGGT